MTEKEIFLDTFEREFLLTVKVIKSYPEGKLSFRPHTRSRSASELAWNFVEEEQSLVGGAIKGSVVFEEKPAPKTLDEILSSYQTVHAELVKQLKDLPDAALNEIIIFNEGLPQQKEMRRGDILWQAITDAIHHRGQFSVYIRMAGGKVPSIYGPSADDPGK